MNERYLIRNEEKHQFDKVKRANLVIDPLTY